MAAAGAAATDLAPPHGACHCRVYAGVSAPGRPGEAALHRCA
ncbi:PIGS isoform 11 [Pan troglodytes]|uniref:PIGS isoform 1 n=2 Tax=Hominidae TaxID=9604 RepID=A0A2J8TMD2_PONAB|nr:PIGS isoform 1 [Pan troglodytes]PNI46922.1 PIGS isoform 11 [Pan troglodytes]PNJ34200.1 PIGS isoform 1 [Pongo abelii]PNJ34203.1 PIGS isoform 11 [Pongo abelii]